MIREIAAAYLASFDMFVENIRRRWGMKVDEVFGNGFSVGRNLH